MKIELNQLMKIPFGYSNQYNIRTYKARMNPESARELNQIVNNANIINLFPTSTGKVIVTIREFTHHPVWRLVEAFIPKKKSKPIKQLTMKLL